MNISSLADQQLKFFINNFSIKFIGSSPYIISSYIFKNISARQT